jgi:hypothetical protein
MFWRDREDNPDAVRAINVSHDCPCGPKRSKVGIVAPHYAMGARGDGRLSIVVRRPFADEPSINRVILGFPGNAFRNFPLNHRALNRAKRGPAFCSRAGPLRTRWGPRGSHLRPRGPVGHDDARRPLTIPVVTPKRPRDPSGTWVRQGRLGSEGAPIAGASLALNVGRPSDPRGRRGARDLSRKPRTARQIGPV